MPSWACSELPPPPPKLVEAMPIVGNLLAFYEAVSGKSWVNVAT